MRLEIPLQEVHLFHGLAPVVKGDASYDIAARVGTELAGDGVGPMPFVVAKPGSSSGLAISPLGDA